MPMANACRECAFFNKQTSLCHRHAPGTTGEEFEITCWPQVKPSDRCGSGERLEKDKSNAPVQCGWCIHWHQPSSRGIEPDYSQGMNEDWWLIAGYCTRFAPGPSGEEGRETFWRVTHQLEGFCGDGERPKKKDKEKAA